MIFMRSRRPVSGRRQVIDREGFNERTISNNQDTGTPGTGR